ncbi:HTH domain-containing protein [Methanothermococcus okinawensis]|uniref:Helix-turn-helix, type 11 domain-containing protein n=1 Tax=Methanothermococcus okinawensis (strain DSM 14208 / JCM 11175 / IH1) TaxID=647113 RepID=F8AJZ7_METOI|nr:helix-turn-helix domain-containing protein [Methanothermococcus okinawensis]AEH07353.1 helix-turn-helix, type 11 domain-containing protein [Methanothermococcus okinawensis IH1]
MPPERLDFKKYGKNLDFWTFLEHAYEKDLKLDLGHFIILCILLEVNKTYAKLIEEFGKKKARKILEEKGIFSKNSDYISGEYLKKYINRESRGAVHSRIKDLKSLGFEIHTKPGFLGGYKLLKTPEWFK